LVITQAAGLQWSGEERRELSDPDYRFLLDEMPSGVHTRPEGGPGSQMILVLWEYNNAAVEPVWPVPVDPFYAEIAVHGLGRLIPGMRQYSGNFTRPTVDGGYYTKTPENRPLIGPLPVPGAYVIGALSGFGSWFPVLPVSCCRNTSPGVSFRIMLPHSSWSATGVLTTWSYFKLGDPGSVIT
jgi:glycine/D-amino acid oxidase-like deaminating enzyme